MLEAIIAAIVTVAVIACVALLVYVVRKRTSDASVLHDDNVEHIEAVGIGSAPAGPASVVEVGDDSHGDVRVKTSKEALIKPADRLGGRFAAMGVLIAGVFTMIGAKLWQMQLVRSDSYASEAESNLYTSISLPASRGRIYDRNEIELVKNRMCQTVLADADVANDPGLLKRLSAVLGIPTGVLKQKVRDESFGAQSQRIVTSEATLRDVAFISEHAAAFPGISVEERSMREYPFGALASHALGYTGSTTDEDLAAAAEAQGRDIESTDVIGKSGLELHYDRLLAGDKGTRRMMVDASGNIVNVVSETAPSRGSDLFLTIDAHAQYVTDKLLASTVAPEDGVIGTGKGVSACVVAIDVTDGSIIVMSSYPTFDPSYLTGGIPQEIWDLYNTEESHSPFVNRAINGQYAPASTFKAFTSMAGLHYGYAGYDSVWNCTGSWDGFGSGDIQKCWDNYGHGTLDLHGGIVHSCDVVFYEIAKAFFDHGPEGTGELSQTALQEYLELYRFGSTTGVDLAGESAGRIPTPEWKAEHWRNVPSEAVWRGGDYSNMIIGQGDVLVTPLQLACAYGGIATGKIMKPHLLKEVRNSKGEMVLTVQPEVVAEPVVNEYHLAYVRDSLHDMLSSHPDLEKMYVDAGIDAAAKSGTAEHTDKKDDAWFAAYAPFNDPKYAVVCIVEQGGGGSDVAGPIVAAVLDELLNNDLPPGAGLGYVEGSSGRSVAIEFTGNSGRQD